MRRSVGTGELAGSSINHPRKKVRWYLAAMETVLVVSSVWRDKSSCNRFDRLVHIRRARGREQQKTEVREREKDAKEQRKRDIQRTRIRMTSFIDQSCLSHTLRLVCKTNYWKDSLLSWRSRRSKMSFPYLYTHVIQSCHALSSIGKIILYCSFNSRFSSYFINYVVFLLSCEKYKPIIFMNKLHGHNVLNEIYKNKVE